MSSGEVWRTLVDEALDGKTRHVIFMASGINKRVDVFQGRALIGAIASRELGETSGPDWLEGRRKLQRTGLEDLWNNLTLDLTLSSYVLIGVDRGLRLIHTVDGTAIRPIFHIGTWEEEPLSDSYILVLHVGVEIRPNNIMYGANQNR